MRHSDYRRRRITNIFWLVLASALVLVVAEVTDTALIDHSEWSGWLLFGVFFLLMVYAVRRRLTTLPLGRMSLWLQAHLYLGAFAALVFLLHCDWQLPGGLVGWSLAVSFLGTVITGAVGIVWSRTLPRRITFLGDEVLYDRIRSFSGGLRDEAERLSLQALDSTGSSALADFFQTSAHQLFTRPRFQWRRLYRYTRPTRKIEHELNVLKRYAGDQESGFIEEMLQLVRRKDVLDGHWTFQGTLRYWLFIHLSFSLAVIPLILLHIILVYGFSAA